MMRWLPRLMVALWFLLLQGCSVLPTEPVAVGNSGSLAGRWEFLPSASTDLPADNARWQRIGVPGNWYAEGYDHHGYAWYRLNFNANAAPDMVSSLHFGGVDYFADVWLNGQKLGSHEGYFQTFAFDVTPHLKSGQNTLLVRVNSPLEQPQDYSLYKRLIKGIFAHHDTRPGGAWSERGQEQNTGGIWGDVSLKQTRRVQLVPQQVQVLPVKGLEQWQVKVGLEVLGKLPEGTTLQWELEENPPPAPPFAKEGSKNRVPSGIAECRPASPFEKGGLRGIFCAIPITHPKLWNPQGYGDPNRYTLTIRAVQNNTTLDSFQRTIAFRKIEKSAHGIWKINHQRILLKGTNYIANQWLSEMSTDDFRRDIALMQAAHINTVRVHAHITSQAFYDLCDAMGLLVWQDFPLQWGYQDIPTFHQQAVAQVGDMIRQFGHHPSIIQWTLHNEPPWDADWMKWKYQDYNPQQNKVLDDKLYKAAVALDKTRPITAISSTREHPWLGWYSGHWLDYAKPTKQSTIAEFGAQALPDRFTLANILGSEPELPRSQADWERWGYHNFQRKETLEIAKVPPGKTLEQFIANTQQYQAQLTQLAAESYRRQAYQPVGALFQFMLVEDWPSMNWGIVDFWRKPKPGYYALQRAYQPLLPSLAWEKVQYVSSEPVNIGLWVLNDSLHRYPAAHYRLTLWQGGQKRDTQDWPVDVRPDMHQHLRDYVAPVREPGAYRLVADITDAQGNTLSRNEYRFSVQSQQ